jgi:amino acid adenylation domain-containing protein
MRRVREVTLGAYEHQDLPFERLVEELQPERNLNHNPLFQVMFSLQNNRSLASSSDSPQSTLEAMENSPKLGTAKFDLALFTEEVDQGLVAGFEYNTDLFEAATIERMVGHFQTLLESILADPDRPIVELPLLTDAERQQLLQEWNDTKTDYPEHACLPQLFEAQVEATPDAVAVLMAGRSWTYRELNGRANQVAHHLRKLGVSTDARVAICLERSLELVAGVLGILKAGGAYVPLDPAYPRERLAFILSDAQASVLLTEERLAGELPTEDVQEVVCLDSSWEVIARESTQNPASVATADNLAYIIYTSGSTGTPKGVGMIHRPLVNLLWWQIRNSRRASEARTLQFAPLSFDVSFQEMFSTWLAGGSLILMAEEERREMGKLLQGMAETEIERLFLPPVVLQQLAETLTDATPSTKLRQIITAGEQLQITEPVTRLFKRFNNCALYNHYGPSESHVVTEFALEGKPDDWPTFPPIGRPIANTRIYLLDAHLQPVPVGVHGELHIGGVALARGYHNRPILTAERFIPDPFSRTPGARLYKTGDRAQYRPDGNIEFLGRIDKQVKIRGFRIELGEIEAVLSRHPAVREAVAVSLTEKSGDKRLVAYLVADNGSILSTTQLYHFLKDQLPEYMIPSAFVQLDALPLTPNGKVNRRALPAPDRQRPELERAFVPPRTLVEQALAEIWSEVLRKEQVGVYDNFFELGGHSLLATQVVSRVREALQVELPLRRLFETPTVADLAVAVISSRAMQTNQEDLTQILAELEDLSEDEARTLLADEV